MSDFAVATEHLRRNDPILANLIERVGPCRLGRKRPDDTFIALTRAIVSQQLSVKAAATIYGRFLDLFPARRPTPVATLRLSDEALRGAGLSRQKSTYLRDLAEKFSNGGIDPDALARMEDEAVIETLTQVKGIGRWTAEMFLIFTLLRPNVLPVDDLGFRRAVKNEYGLDELPTAEEIRELAVRWDPYCSIATWYLWASLGNAPM